MSWVSPNSPKTTFYLDHAHDLAKTPKLWCQGALTMFITWGFHSPSPVPIPRRRSGSRRGWRVWWSYRGGGRWWRGWSRICFAAFSSPSIESVWKSESVWKNESVNEWKCKRMKVWKCDHKTISPRSWWRDFPYVLNEFFGAFTQICLPILQIC